MQSHSPPAGLVWTGAPLQAEVEALVRQGALSPWALLVFRSGPFAAPAAAAAADAAQGVNRSAAAEGGRTTEYSIRMALKDTPPCWERVERYRKSRGSFSGAAVPDRYKRYVTSGFLSLQAAVAAYALGQPPHMEGSLLLPLVPPPQTDDGARPDDAPPAAAPTSDHNASTQRPQQQRRAHSVWLGVMPQQAHKDDRFYLLIAPLFGLLLVSSFMLPLAMFLRGTVAERECGLRPLLLLHGCHPALPPAAWLLAYLPISLAAAALASLLAILTFLPTTSLTLLFVLFASFSVAQLAAATALATLLSSSRVAAAAGPLLMLAAALPKYVFSSTADTEALWLKHVAALLPPTALSFGVDLLLQHESNGSGLRWDTVGADPLPMSAVLLILALDAALFLALAAVLAWARGTGAAAASRLVRKALTAAASTLAGHQCKNEGKGQGPAGKVKQQTEASSNSSSPVRGSQLRAAVLAEQLCKTYPNGVQALQGLSLKLAYGELLGLLGTNGAGKSTFCSILTGQESPTSGSCLINGHNQSSGSQAARQMGVCPQHNVHFFGLTVAENLAVAAAIKGVPWTDVWQAAQKTHMQLGLGKEENTLAGQLSGGGMRKLQVGMALVGGSRLLVLGMYAAACCGRLHACAR